MRLGAGVEQEMDYDATAFAINLLGFGIAAWLLYRADNRNIPIPVLSPTV